MVLDKDSSNTHCEFQRSIFNIQREMKLQSGPKWLEMIQVGKFESP